MTLRVIFTQFQILLLLVKVAVSSICLSENGVSCASTIKVSSLNVPPPNYPYISSKVGVICSDETCKTPWLRMSDPTNIWEVINGYPLIGDQNLTDSCTSVCSSTREFFTYFHNSNLSEIEILNGVNPPYQGIYRNCLPWLRCDPFKKRSLTLGNFSAQYSINGEVLLTTPDPENTFFRLTIRSISSFVTCTNSPCTYSLASFQLISDGILYVSVFFDSIYIGDFNFTISKIDSCAVVTCTFICREYFTHFLCYSTSAQIFLGISFVISGLLLTLLILFLIYKSIKNDWCIRLTTQYRLMKAAEIFKKKLEEDKDTNSIDENEDSSSGSQSFVENPVTDLKMSRIKPKLNRTFCIMLIMVLTTPSISAECIGITTLQSNFVECTHNPSGTQTCQLTLNVQSVLPHLGSSSCIVVKSNIDHQVIGHIKLTYTNLILRAILQFQYWTAPFVPLSQSVRFCSGTSTECEDNACGAVSPYDTSLFSGEVIEYPGVTECRAACGCAGCGCFYCEDSCLYSRYAIKPIGEPYRVASIGEIQRIPVITIEFSDGNSTVSEEITFFSQTHSIMGFDFINVGEISSTTTSLLTLGVISNSGHQFLGPISDRNSPEFNTFGTLQAEFHDWLETPPFIFNLPNSGISSIASPDTVHYSFPSDSFENSALMHDFPYTVGSTVWEFDDQFLVGMDSNPGPALIYFSSTDPISVELEVTSVCPVISSVTVNGCYDCPQGASLSISAYSSCDAGSVEVIIISDSRLVAFPTFASLSTVSTSFIIPFFSQDSSVSGLVELRFSDFLFDNFTFVGALEDPPLIHANGINVSSLPTNQENSDFSSWWNSFTGGLGILKWFIAVLLIGGAISIILLFAYLAFTSYKSTVVYL